MVDPLERQQVLEVLAEPSVVVPEDIPEPRARATVRALHHAVVDLGAMNARRRSAGADRVVVVAVIPKRPRDARRAILFPRRETTRQHRDANGSVARNRNEDVTLQSSPSWGPIACRSQICQPRERAVSRTTSYEQ